MVGNIATILNFAKQGLHDSVNITLTSLAACNIGSLIFLMMKDVFWGYVYMPISPSASVLFIYPNRYFTRVGGCITTFAAFERCLCVVLPLKTDIIALAFLGRIDPTTMLGVEPLVNLTDIYVYLQSIPIIY
ncbi:hypothetical protein Btru_070355 [Bulinus truncatus]|nr:hypothetical protein Btru_070355 [Bulinus truncatus]